MLSLLIANQDGVTTQEISRRIESHGTRIQAVSGGEQLLKAAIENSPEIAILDMSIPLCDTLQAISYLRRSRSHVGVIVTSDAPITEDVVTLLKAGAQDFVRKPIDVDALVEKIVDLIEVHSPASHALARRLDQYVRHNSKSPNLQLATVSKHFKISRSYASKLFREKIGQAFRERLLGLRLERTKAYLESTDLPLYLIAYNCGFRCQARMSEVFKRKEGLSPRMYRRARIGHCGQLPTKS